MLGVWGPKWVPEAVAFLTAKYASSHFSWYCSKKLTYICVSTLQNIYFNITVSGKFDKFVFQNWFSLQIHYSANQRSGAHLGPQVLHF